MANPTYTLIQSVNLTTNTSVVTLGSGGTLPQTYTDLKLVISARTSRAGGLNTDSVIIKYNGSSSSYNSVYLLVNNGTGIASGTDTAGIVVFTGADPSDATANTFGNSEVYIPNYAGNQYKSASMDGVSEANSSNFYMGLTAALWSNTAAITSMTMTPYVGSSFLTNSTFYLYGIKNS